MSEEEDCAGEGGQNGFAQRIQHPRHRRSVPRQIRDNINKRSANKENVQPAGNIVETLQPHAVKILNETGDQIIQVLFIRESRISSLKLNFKKKSKLENKIVL